MICYARQYVSYHRQYLWQGPKKKDLNSTKTITHSIKEKKRKEKKKPLEFVQHADHKLNKIDTTSLILDS